MDNETVELKENENQVIALPKEEADKIRNVVKRIQEEVAEELDRNKEEMTQGRSK